MDDLNTANENIRKIEFRFKAYIASMIAAAVATILFIIVIILFMNDIDNDDLGYIQIATISVMSIIMIGLIVSTVVFWAMTHHLNWKAIEPYSQRTTPGLAVGLMFIPFFNLYWAFVSYHQLAQDMNRVILSKGESAPVKANENLALAYCILKIASIIPCVNYLASLPAFIVGIICLGNLKDTAKFIFALEKTDNDKILDSLITDREW